mmetsp:Transcript_13775/g.17399  ORF Transcript_13775/g.17399 Transcript_13775/m.17399 type:complete len:141 (-) Transcript_13775:751-1173(-)
MPSAVVIRRVRHFLRLFLVENHNLISVLLVTTLSQIVQSFANLRIFDCSYLGRFIGDAMRCDGGVAGGFVLSFAGIRAVSGIRVPREHVLLLRLDLQVDHHLARSSLAVVILRVLLESVHSVSASFDRVAKLLALGHTRS